LKRPSITVLLPVYNAEPYLAQALQSVLAQTYGDFEVIVVDDGSTDGSREIITRYAREESRIRVIARENRGLVQSLNEGLSQATGEYVARMDADDVCLPERFSKQVTFLRTNPDHVVVGSSFIYIDEHGAETRRHACFVNDVTIRHALPVEGSIRHPSAMLRTRALLEIGGYSDHYFAAEDYDLVRRLAHVGQLHNLPDVLLHYRESPTRVSSTHARQQRRSADLIRAEIWRDALLSPWKRVSLRTLARLPGETVAVLEGLQKDLAKLAIQHRDPSLFLFLCADLIAFRALSRRRLGLRWPSHSPPA
jgi:glycosyltransferase involved in cell wall biosynthesis